MDFEMPAFDFEDLLGYFLAEEEGNFLDMGGSVDTNSSTTAMAEVTVEQERDPDATKLQTKSSLSKRYQCSTCGSSFNRKDNLKRHMLSHDGSKVPCHLCGRYFRSVEDMNVHKGQQHPSYLCSYCGRVFYSKSNLDEHVRNKHEGGSRAYVCQYEDCGRQFARKVNFQDHLNAHTGAKPFACDNCRKTFSDRYTRTKHRKACPGGEEVYKCGRCGKSFIGAACPYDHTRVRSRHELFSCVCGKQYTWRTNLVRHMKNCDEA